MPQPCLQPDGRDAAAHGTDSVLLVVHAPFASDATFGTYPDGSTTQLHQHPLLHNLIAASAHGVHVAALIDGVGPETCLVEIPARHPERMQTTSCWKQDMASPYTLAGLLHRAHATHPTAAMVLVIEGPGTGFVPEIDRASMRLRDPLQGATGQWRVGAPGPDDAGVSLSPPVSPQDLLVAYPFLPVGALPLSTWGLGHALREARRRGVPKLAVLSLNHSFSMLVEAMHTVAPHAEYATGYSDYTYFTAGGSYAWVFEHLARAGRATSAELASWLAGGSAPHPAGSYRHATGGVVQLARMAEIARRIDDMSDALLAAMRVADPAQRKRVIDMVQRAVEAARHRTTPGDAGPWTATPVEMVDIGAFAGALSSAGSPTVSPTAAALESALQGRGRSLPADGAWGPASAPRVLWDAFASDLIMNIHFPDPLRRGVWDWRSPFYMNVNGDPRAPTSPPAIDFLKETDWVDFIAEYHADASGMGRVDRITGFQVPDLPAMPSAMVFKLEMTVAASRKDIDTQAVLDAATTLERLLQQQLEAWPASESPARDADVQVGGRRGVRCEAAARSVRPGSLVFSFEIFVAVVGGAYAIVGSYSKAKESWLELRPDLLSFLAKARSALEGPLGRSAVRQVRLELRGSDDLDRELAAFSQAATGQDTADGGRPG